MQNNVQANIAIIEEPDEHLADRLQQGERLHRDRAGERARFRLECRTLGCNRLARIGEPFARPAPGSGTGVGLYVSRQLIQRMHGSLQWRRAGNGGFAVVVELPEAA